ncbi:MAG: hypothetical protein ABGW88_13615 [Leeuwenhoekiella sp.]
MPTKEIKYKEQFGVIIHCQNEEHQKKIYEELKAKGHKLKVVTV